MKSLGSGASGENATLLETRASDDSRGDQMNPFQGPVSGFVKKSIGTVLFFLMRKSGQNTSGRKKDDVSVHVCIICK